MGRSAELVVALWAVRKPAPRTCRSTRPYPADRMGYMLRESGPVFALVDQIAAGVDAARACLADAGVAALVLDAADSPRRRWPASTRPM